MTHNVSSSKVPCESAGKPLLLTRIFECIVPSAESQRDSATKPRVARNELPWENARHIGDNPERVVADDYGIKSMPHPRWGCESSVTFPRVARSSAFAWLRRDE